MTDTPDKPASPEANGAGDIAPISITTELKKSYLDYAMSVIVSRALPDVRDGLKPVHRRILYAAYEGGYTHDKAFRKSANIVGDVIGRWHPHGDQSIYDALVRMAQPFSMSVPLVEGQGNFGSIDGDPPAAMRYTESRMAKITAYMLDDIDKDTVNFEDNYDGSRQEPSVLPSKFPNLLVNGAGGIAVGMATNIPPHNITEIIDATIALIENPAMEDMALLDIVPLSPVQPMLAEPAASVSDALEQLGTAAFELKLDGARIQVHKQGDSVRVFTRSLQDVSARVPEVAELLAQLPARELILDGEAIALRPDGRPLPFQDTMRRFGKKLDIDSARVGAPLSLFFFDCLYCDGVSLLDRATEQRVTQLHAVVPAANCVERLVTDDVTRAEAFVARALDLGHEGAMAKALDAPYAAGSRGSSWLKLKLAHTLDLVVLAAEWGSGRRTGTLSNLHLGARDAEHGGFVMLGKTFKGLSDELLRYQTEALLQRETHRDAYTVYVRPELVVEIALNDVQTSPHYPAGLALRFARVKRYRPDKTAQEADTLERVRMLHAVQRR